MDKNNISKDFFSANDSIWGIFYPTNHIVAVFDSSEDANSAKKNAISKIRDKNNICVLSGETVAKDIMKGMENDSWLAKLKQTIVAGLGNSMDYWEYDLQKAQHGANFLVVYCPDEELVYDIARLIQAKDPTSMRLYLPLVIEDLKATLELNN